MLVKVGWENDIKPFEDLAGLRHDDLVGTLDRPTERKRKGGKAARTDQGHCRHLVPTTSP